MERLKTEGASYREHEANQQAIVPIYAAGILTGALILDGVKPESVPMLSAVASLASVAVESVREVQRLRADYAALERRVCGNGGILGHSPAILKLLDQIEKLAPREFQMSSTSGFKVFDPMFLTPCS